MVQDAWVCAVDKLCAILVMLHYVVFMQASASVSVVSTSNDSEGDTMSRPRVTSIAVDSFFDNFTCAALFGRLRIPGSPREIIDTRPVDIFWIDELRQIMADVKRIVRLAQVAAISGILFESVSESLITSKVLESFQSSLSPSVKLQLNAHQPQ
jgi:hypothetical protein